MLPQGILLPEASLCPFISEIIIHIILLHGYIIPNKWFRLDILSQTSREQHSTNKDFCRLLHTKYYKFHPKYFFFFCV